jgi:hypothetical protein
MCERENAELMKWTPILGPLAPHRAALADAPKPGKTMPPVRVDDGGEIDEAARHRNIGDVHRPHFVCALDLQSSQQIGIDSMAWTTH